VKAGLEAVSGKRFVNVIFGQRGDHDGLDGVQAVFGLEEGDIARGLEDLVVHLHAVDAVFLEDLLSDGSLAVVESGEAVQEPAPALAGHVHDPARHAVGLEHGDAILPHIVRLAHGDPDVGVEEVAAPDAFLHAFGARNAGAGLFGNALGHLEDGIRSPQRLGRHGAEVDAELGAADHEGVAHVEAGVAEVGERDPVPGASAGALAHGERVGQELGGVPLACEAVPDRNRSIVRQGLDDRLTEAAVLDAVEEAGEHAGGVGHGFLPAHLGTGWADAGAVRALVVGADLKGAARARGVLLEEDHDVASLEEPGLPAGLLGLLEAGGKLNEVDPETWIF